VRRAYQDVRWELGQRGVLLGLSLGFDKRAEHVEGISPLLVKLGVQLPLFPVGLEDRQVKQAPPTLRFSTYQWVPKDKRRGSYPAALLILASCAEGDLAAQTVPEAEIVGRYDLGFLSEASRRLPSVPEHDLVAAWGAEGFAVHVRGERNIEMLERLYEAIVSRDVAVLAPAKHSGTGPVRLLLASQMTVEDQAQLVAADQEYRELMRAVLATGIFPRLAQFDRGFRSLTPAWFDEKQDEVIFLLEPDFPNAFNSGWFTLEELDDWTRDRGPVMRDAWLEQLTQRAYGEMWESRLTQGLMRSGAQPRYGVQLIWMDDRQLSPGLRYRATRASEHVLPSGNYLLTPTMNHYAMGLEVAERRT